MYTSFQHRLDVQEDAWDGVLLDQVIDLLDGDWHVEDIHGRWALQRSDGLTVLPFVDRTTCRTMLRTGVDDRAFEHSIGVDVTRGSRAVAQAINRRLVTTEAVDDWHADQENARQRQADEAATGQALQQLQEAFGGSIHDECDLRSSGLSVRVRRGQVTTITVHAIGCDPDRAVQAIQMLLDRSGSTVP